MCLVCVCVCCSILNTFLKEYSVMVPLMPVQYPSYDVLLCLILVQRADVMLPPPPNLLLETTEHQCFCRKDVHLSAGSNREITAIILVSFIEPHYDKLTT